MVDILIHKTIDIISVLSFLVSLYYIAKIKRSMGGGFGKGYLRIGMGLVLFLAVVILLNLMDFGVINGTTDDMNFSVDILMALGSLTIMWGVIKINSVIEYIPQTIIGRINSYL